jgi:hypothetical protein
MSEDTLCRVDIPDTSEYPVLLLPAVSSQPLLSGFDYLTSQCEKINFVKCQ